jgi:ABC-type nitrate/sulfonate/bicarbonate transport system permease component
MPEWFPDIDLWPHIAASLARSLPGFVIGSLAGTALGLWAGVTRAVDEMVSPSVFMTYPVPKVVLLPLIMVWLGLGDAAKIATIALGCFYPCFIHAYYGARSTRTMLVWSALNMGAGRWRVFFRVVLPSALPLILVGLRTSMGLSFILLFATEMIGARSGLGYLIKQSELSMRFDLMYVSILAMVLLGLAGDALLRLARRLWVSWDTSP